MGRCLTLPGTGSGTSSSTHWFFDLVAEFAVQTRNPAATAIVECFGAPLRVAVLGRRGVGRDAVAGALTGAGVTIVTQGPDGADVAVLVVAEALKPEERAQLRAASNASVATMVVLNKADLGGAGDPLASAERSAAEFAVTVGRPVVPMIALLADVGLDEDDVSALRALAATPADMTSTDAFVSPGHPLPAELRMRLLTSLDRFGLAHAILAVAAGETSAAIGCRLRAFSQVDRVVERLNALSAPVRYRRVCDAMLALRALAVQSGDDRLDEFLIGDEAVISVMASAADVLASAGFGGEGCEGGDGDGCAQLRLAARWSAYAQAPLDILHQRCARDVARGSLRLLGRLR